MTDKIRCTDKEGRMSACTNEAVTFFRQHKDGRAHAACLKHHPIDLIAAGRMDVLTREEYVVARVHES